MRLATMAALLLVLSTWELAQPWPNEVDWCLCSEVFSSLRYVGLLPLPRSCWVDARVSLLVERERHSGEIATSFPFHLAAVSIWA
jgi:hypothetical protein